MSDDSYRAQRTPQRGGFWQLKAWQKADDLAFEVWQLSRKISPQESWLANQIKRCSSSVPANIAEGYSRLSTREYLHHLSIARASLAETEYWLHFGQRLGQFKPEDVQPLSPFVTEAGNLLYGLIRALARKLKSGGSQNDYVIREMESEYGRDGLDDQNLDH